MFSVFSRVFYQIQFIALVFLGKWCLVRAGLVYVLLRDSTQQKWCSQLTLKEKQPICWDEASVLEELCLIRQDLYLLCL